MSAENPTSASTSKPQGVKKARKTKKDVAVAYIHATEVVAVMETQTMTDRSKIMADGNKTYLIRSDAILLAMDDFCVEIDVSGLSKEDLLIHMARKKVAMRRILARARVVDEEIESELAASVVAAATIATDASFEGEGEEYPILNHDEDVDARGREDGFGDVDDAEGEAEGGAVGDLTEGYNGDEVYSEWAIGA